MVKLSIVFNILSFMKYNNNNNKFMISKVLINNKNLYNLSKIKNRTLKITYKSTYTNFYKKKNRCLLKIFNKFRNFICPFVYIPALLFTCGNCRDIVNNFPINLTLYGVMMPLQMLATEWFFIYILMWICFYALFCEWAFFGQVIRHHSNFSNQLDILFTIICFGFSIIGDTIKWSYISPIILSSTHSWLFGTLFYTIYYAINFKFPYLPKIHHTILPPERK
uniref:Translocon of the chloroplast inner membrane protein n=1 Tax=Lotharella vacuolata TaxID=74820 RepID=A0A0H5BHT4_9EUKA|nr:translocon of the chloroplast inner membrane protein [Lotharella vacuolata]